MIKPATDVSEKGRDFLLRHEGYRLEPYRDTAGKWTIGVGHLLLPGEPLGAWSHEKVETALRQDMAKGVVAIRNEVRIPLTQPKFDALASLVFNIGVPRFRQSTVLRLINSERASEAEVENWWTRWDKVTKPDGRVVQDKGLTNRRAAEWALWSRGDYGEGV